MPCTTKYVLPFDAHDPTIVVRQNELMGCQTQILEHIFGSRDRRPEWILEGFDPRNMKVRMKALSGDDKCHWYIEIPEDNEVEPFDDAVCTGAYWQPKRGPGRHRGYRDFIVRASMMPLKNARDVEAVARSAIKDPRCVWDDGLLITNHVFKEDQTLYVSPVRGEWRKAWVDVLAVKPHTVPLADIWQQLANHPSLVEDLADQMTHYRRMFAEKRVQTGQELDVHPTCFPEEPRRRYLDEFDPHNWAAPSLELEGLQVRLPAAGFGQRLGCEHFTARRLIHILGEVAPQTAYCNVVFASQTDFRIFVGGSNSPSVAFSKDEISPLATAFGLTYDFADFAHILVRKSRRRIDPATGRPFWDIKHLVGWETARFQPYGVDLIEWDAKWPFHQRAAGVWYQAFRRSAWWHRTDCLPLHTALDKFQETMHELWTRPYRLMGGREQQDRVQLAEKRRRSGWSWKGAQRGYEKSLVGKIRDTFRASERCTMVSDSGLVPTNGKSSMF